MDIKTKRISKLPQIEAIGEKTNIIVEENGETKKIPASSVGGGLPSGGAPYQQLVTDGEGNAKWEDRPYKNVQPVDFLSGEVSLTFGDGRPTTISTTKTFISGQEYTVSWDSVEYKCEAYVVEGPNSPSVGNGTIAGLYGGNGEPFFITIYEGKLGIFAQEDGAHTVRIVGTEIVVRTIDSELMPDGYPKLETKEVSFLSETSVAFEWDASGVGHTSVPCPSGMLEDGKTYAITVNGETHTCKAVRTDYEDDYEISCGKDRTASGEDPTGEPFFIFSNPNWPDELIVRTTNDMLPTPSIFTVVEIEETIQPLDPKYLPAVKIVVDEDSNTYTGNVETYEDFSRHILNGSPVVVHYVSSGKVVEVCNAASVKHTDMPTEWEIYVRRADGEWRLAARYIESVPGIFPGSA